MKKHDRIFLLLAACALLLTACGKNNGTAGTDNEKLYGELIAGLEDEEQFALLDIGEPNDVLFTSDLTYDDGNGHNAALCCTLHYSFDGELCDVYVEGMGTAYPISYGDRCVYAASGHSLNIYRIDQKEKQWVVSLYEEVISRDGEASYQLTENGETKSISEHDYEKALAKYGESAVVNFGYGASDNPF